MIGQNYVLYAIFSAEGKDVPNIIERLCALSISERLCAIEPTNLRILKSVERYGGQLEHRELRFSYRSISMEIESSAEAVHRMRFLEAIGLADESPGSFPDEPIYVFASGVAEALRELETECARRAGW
jgi:hypothetical protein